MSWNTFWNSAIADIDDAEARTERTWARSAVAIAAVVWWLRRRTTERTIRLPIVNGGWIDPVERAKVGRFRLDVVADVQEANRRLVHELMGGQRYMSRLDAAVARARDHPLKRSWNRVRRSRRIGIGSTRFNGVSSARFSGRGNGRTNRRRRPGQFRRSCRTDCRRLGWPRSKPNSARGEGSAVEDGASGGRRVGDRRGCAREHRA